MSCHNVTMSCHNERSVKMAFSFLLNICGHGDLCLVTMLQCLVTMNEALKWLSAFSSKVVATETRVLSQCLVTMNEALKWLSAFSSKVVATETRVLSQ